MASIAKVAGANTTEACECLSVSGERHWTMYCVILEPMSSTYELPTQAKSLTSRLLPFPRTIMFQGVNKSLAEDLLGACRECICILA